MDTGEFQLVPLFRVKSFSRFPFLSLFFFSPRFGCSEISGKVCLNLSDQTQLRCRIKVREHKFAALSKHLTRHGKDRMCDAGIFIKGWHVENLIHSVL